MILEIASGQTYPDFTREQLFKPAGMNDTGFFGEPYPEQRLAIGYGPRMDGKINAPPYWGKTSWLVMGSGGQVSTAPDMWRWVQALYGGKILSPASLRRYGDGQNVFAGGDTYGFEIVYAGNNRSAMVIMSNVGSPQRMPGWRRLTDEFASLVLEHKPSKFVLGVQLKIDDNDRVKLGSVTPNGAAANAGLRRRRVDQGERQGTRQPTGSLNWCGYANGQPGRAGNRTRRQPEQGHRQADAPVRKLRRTLQRCGAAMRKNVSPSSSAMIFDSSSLPDASTAELWTLQSSARSGESPARR